MLTSAMRRTRVRSPRRPGRPKRARWKRSRLPRLRFTPTAWAKLLFLRDRGPTEVGGFGISDPDDLLRVTDVVLVRQDCTETFVAFDDLAVAEFFEEQVDLGRQPAEFGRIWIHTHPGSSAAPSAVDRQTMQRVFGGCDWGVMFILSHSGQTHAELHWRLGGPARLPLEVEIDYSAPFPASDCIQWATEYAATVQEHTWPRTPGPDPTWCAPNLPPF